MNKKGFAATGILYTILVLFILLMMGILTMLYSRNSLLDTIKKNVKNEIINGNTCSNLVGTVWNFDYTGNEQTFTVPCNGTYKLETWGAEGATDSSTYHGGYGAYANGQIVFKSGEKKYIYVGEKGKNINTMRESGIALSYPNGGSVYSGGNSSYDINYSSGGASTHISSKSGLIAELSSSKDSILIVSAGGGGACVWWGDEKKDNGGSGGGIIGSTTTNNFPNAGVTNNPTGGTQSQGGLGGGNLDGASADKWLNGIFGIGGGTSVTATYNISGAGGGGYYGGGASWGGSGAGGSSYIGNSLLTNKAMYCYNCTESNDISTKTVSTTCTNSTPTSNCAKKGNGYAKITFVSLS